MASYTTNYGLHQWEASDNFLRTDFNTDFGIIDQILGELSGCLVIGSYTGDGTGDRAIDLGFRPRILLLSGRFGGPPHLYSQLSVHFGDYAHAINSDGAGAGNSSVTVTDQGFQVKNGYHNVEGYPEHYLAVKPWTEKTADGANLAAPFLVSVWKNAAD